MNLVGHRKCKKARRLVRAELWTVSLERHAVFDRTTWTNVTPAVWARRGRRMMNLARFVAVSAIEYGLASRFRIVAIISHTVVGQPGPDCVFQFQLFQV